VGRGFIDLVALGDDDLLRDEQLLLAQRDAQVAAVDQDAVGGRQDVVHVVEPLDVLDAAHHAHVVAASACNRARHTERIRALGDSIVSSGMPILSARMATVEIVVNSPPCPHGGDENA
jgi:hypothetical protein